MFSLDRKAKETCNLISCMEREALQALQGAYVIEDNGERIAAEADISSMSWRIHAQVMHMKSQMRRHKCKKIARLMDAASDALLEIEERDDD